jgi:GlcNAc-P-P-Und epimerase
MRLLFTGASGFIGVNAVAHFSKRTLLINLDIQAPLDDAQHVFWRKLDIMDFPALRAALTSFSPTHVVHMAARTECVENVSVEEGYAVNTVGTQNVLNAVGECNSVQRLVVVSSQYVCGPGRLPRHDTDFFPHTVYGQSKAVSELLTRKSALPCQWVIVRPTNVWGPWHLRYRREAWHVIGKGFYLHPGGDPVVRSYAYVGNVVWQIDNILQAATSAVNEQVFYLGDAPVDIYQWSDAFSMALRGQHAHRVPRSILRALGLFGSLAASLGISFPLTSRRFRSMTQNYPTPMKKTLDTFGPPPFTLNQGVSETVKWLTSYKPTGKDPL